MAAKVVFINGFDKYEQYGKVLLFNGALTIEFRLYGYFCFMSLGFIHFFSKYRLQLAASICAVLCCSCKSDFDKDNHTAYFGGLVTKTTGEYVLFCKNDKVIDTIKLDANNRFFVKFDSLPEGLYTFKYEPEYQYVYFDKNDSILVRINPEDFDESIVYSGRGAQKNNVLMDLYLKNERDKDVLFDYFDTDYKLFSAKIDSLNVLKQDFYSKKKKEIKWSDGFDKFARAMIDYNHFSKKEVYPIVHQMRTGHKILNDLPKDYYEHRENVNFNDTDLIGYAPFISYLNFMLNNVAMSSAHDADDLRDQSLEINIHKIKVADTLFKNETIKNSILNNIAFMYMLEDQNISNNKRFLDTYYRVSTDKSKQSEIRQMGNAIQQLTAGKRLPSVQLLDASGKTFNSDDIVTEKTVIFFWSESLQSHLIAAHKRIQDFQKKHPDYKFIAINVDKNQQKWTKTLANFKFGTISEYRAADFEDLRKKWVINKIHRTIITDSRGNIANAFVSLFDVAFESKM
ncbi:TlpA family protein disulfide reductase [Flavobacterium aurantiibacter]|uniref:Thioredoxin-like fold domain-containing protein n=1 Tax=Flavobacterium aurantiibacter TaxID=2023067 RepID=A0A255ZFB5_9FLAO|nr:thioredoxin-like domain-containing protein [Flavobacterium aurantiibacter]OYQ39594.1 hypothetical protein CHX27_13935 [Flavobacterium aurantiibacter]